MGVGGGGDEGCCEGRKGEGGGGSWGVKGQGWAVGERKGEGAGGGGGGDKANGVGGLGGGGQKVIN